MAARSVATPRRSGRVAGAVLATFLLVFAALRLWVIEPVHITSNSMLPAVRPGAYALVLATSAARDGLAPDDLVVFEAPGSGEPTLKRVIALGGQDVSIRDAVVYVDGAERREPGIDASAIDGSYFGPVTVPRGSVFVLGDNREASLDSRHHGPVPLEQVRGRVLFLWNGAG